MMAGGHSDVKKCVDNVEEKEMFEGMKGEVEAKTGKTYGSLTAVHYTSQVVAGCNYWVKFVTDGGEYIHVKIFKPLPHTGNPATISEHHEGQTEDAAFNH